MTSVTMQIVRRLLLKIPAHPSPLVGEGREGGTRSDRSERAAIPSGNKEDSPVIPSLVLSYAFSREGGPLPPSPTLPHEGGEGDLGLYTGPTIISSESAPSRTQP
jgi:hypothetical protein